MPKRCEWRSKADVIVLAIGGNEQTSREAWNLQHMGDRTSLDLIGRQEELVKAMVALGKPVIVFLFNGRPLSINYIAENVPVIFECWYLGQETGHAVADVLFGDYNPGGKLPIIGSALGRPSAGVLQLQAIGAARLSVRRCLAAVCLRLRPELHQLRHHKSAADKEEEFVTDGSTQVSVDVTNTGKRAGAEVVQLYIRDLVSSVTRPVKELKGFQQGLAQAGRNHHRHARHHAGAAFLLRREHEVRRRTRRLCNHGRQFFPRRRSDRN